MRRALGLLVWVLCSGGGPQASAQNFAIRERTVYWDGSRRIEIKGDEGTSPRVLREKAGPLEVDPAWKDLYWFEGELWGRKRDGQGAVLGASRDGRRWREAARAKAGALLHRAATVRALGHGRYLVVASPLLGGAYALDGAVSRFAVVRVDGRGEASLERLIPMQLDKRLEHYQPFQFSVEALPIEDGWALVAPRTGQIWTATWGSEGFRSRKISLLPAVEELLAKDPKAPLEGALVAAEARMDGSLLLVTRTQEAVLHAWKTTASTPEPPAAPPAAQPAPVSPFRGGSGSTLSREQALAAFRKDAGSRKSAALAGTLDREGGDATLIRRRQSLRDHPDLCWWEVDGQGRARRIGAPAGAPSQLQGFGDFYRIPERMLQWLR